jgi:uncharacterized protein
MYKTSHYNIYVPIEEKGKILIYKTSTGGLAELSQEEGRLLLEWDKKGISSSDLEGNIVFIQELKDNGFIVDESLNEIEELHKHYLKCHNKEGILNQRPIVGISIAPTTKCNMACEYCYAYKRTGADINSSIEDNIYAFLGQIQEKLANKFANPQNGGVLNISWIGGEPTLNPQAFKSLSERFIRWAKINHLTYYSEMITNGLLLNEEWTELLKVGAINHVQITIDGNKEKHNASRPLAEAYKNENNYERILENLSRFPDDIKVSIRINADKTTIETLEELLNDLKKYGIWPQKAKNISLYLAPKRAYNIDKFEIVTIEGAGFDNYFKDFSEYFPYKEYFNNLKLEHYNKWALEVGEKTMKKKWKVPKGMKKDCGINNPNSIVVSADGYIYKCWEHIDMEEYRLQSANEIFNFDNSKNKEWLEYDRFTNYKKCYNCKYIPFCDIVTCPAIKFSEEESPCCSKKFHLKRTIKQQYIDSIDYPNITESLEEYIYRVQEGNLTEKFNTLTSIIDNENSSN